MILYIDLGTYIFFTYLLLYHMYVLIILYIYYNNNQSINQNQSSLFLLYLCKGFN